MKKLIINILGKLLNHPEDLPFRLERGIGNTCTLVDGSDYYNFHPNDVSDIKIEFYLKNLFSGVKMTINFYRTRKPISLTRSDIRIAEMIEISGNIMKLKKGK